MFLKPRREKLVQLGKTLRKIVSIMVKQISLVFGDPKWPKKGGGRSEIFIHFYTFNSSDTFRLYYDLCIKPKDTKSPKIINNIGSIAQYAKFKTIGTEFEAKIVWR